MTPTVFRLSETEAGVVSGSVGVGDRIAGGVVIKTEPRVIEICYTKIYDECNTCSRFMCPFSGVVATQP